MVTAESEVVVVPICYLKDQLNTADRPRLSPLLPQDCCTLSTSQFAICGQHGSTCIFTAGAAIAREPWRKKGRVFNPVF